MSIIRIKILTIRKCISYKNYGLNKKKMETDKRWRTRNLCGLKAAGEVSTYCFSME